MKAPPRATLRPLMGEVWADMPGAVLGAVGLALAVSAAEAASVLTLVPLLGVVGLPVPGGGAGWISRFMLRAFALVGARPTLASVLVLFLLVAAAQALLQRGQVLLGWRVEVDFRVAIRRRLYRAIAEARWLHLTRLRSSDLLEALTAEVDRCGQVLSFLVLLISYGLVSLAYLGLALRVSAPASLVAGACGVVLMLVLRGFGRRVREAGRDLTLAHNELTAAATEHLQSMKVVKSYGAEERNVAHFNRTAVHARNVYLGATRTQVDSRALFHIGSVLLLCAVIWVSVTVLHLQGSVTLLLAFIFFRLVPRLQNMLQSYQMMMQDLPAYENVRARIAELEAEREQLAPGQAVHVLAQGVRFEGVSFAYPGTHRAAVESLDLAVEARRTTAIVGPSGSGKTTVADLLMGLVRPAAGRVVVDGRELDESWLRGWRGGIGYVAQDTVLFHDSVLNNLSWARPEASEAQIRAALRAAAAEGFVSALPEEIHTVLGDRGVRLSGGERQRLALARALLREPALLLLDEATSALDSENERRIREAITALHGRVTILLITHRLSSVRDADVIHVMEGGRLVESGDWRTLMQRPDGRFRALWLSQEMGEASALSPAAEEPAEPALVIPSEPPGANIGQ
jgi:ATP-binding cassette subfamily C protein